MAASLPGHPDPRKKSQPAVISTGEIPNLLPVTGRFRLPLTAFPIQTEISIVLPGILDSDGIRLVSINPQIVIPA